MEGRTKEEVEIKLAVIEVGSERRAGHLPLNPMTDLILNCCTMDISSL